MPKHAVIIGGGLAGMTAALNLRREGMRVTLLEADKRVGGKAGSEKILNPLTNKGQVYEDHGYHIFPAWYVNTRHLLKELGCEDTLIDLDCFHHFVRSSGKPTKRVTMREWST